MEASDAQHWQAPDKNVWLAETLSVKISRAEILKTKFIARKNDCWNKFLHIGNCFSYGNQTVKLVIIPSGERNKSALYITYYFYYYVTITYKNM